MAKQEEIVTLKEIADILKRRKEVGEKPFILFIGGGASLYSSNPQMTYIVEQFLCDMSVAYDKINQMDDFQRFENFSELLGNFPPTERYEWFSKIFRNALPSPGFLYLTELLRHNYFDIVLSTAIDTILEEAIKENKNIKYDDRSIFIMDEHLSPTIQDYLSRNIPRIKIFKLRGDIIFRKFFLKPEETFEFSKEVESELIRLFKERDVLMVGYHILHDNILRCIKKNERILIFICSTYKRGLYDKLALPYHTFRVLTGIDAQFDRFFIKLHELLIN